MKKHTKTIEKKTKELIENGSVNSDDFSDLDQWNQKDSTHRQLSEAEQEQLREIAKNQIKKHQENKPS